MDFNYPRFEELPSDNPIEKFNEFMQFNEKIEVTPPTSIESTTSVFTQITPETTNSLNGLVSDKPKVKERAKRSRGGCSSCKKLKIKCDEQKPKCEYCTHTGRDCVYPPLKATKTKNKLKYIDPGAAIANYFTDLGNTQVREINSYTHQLNISSFELRLLKDFLQFGGTLFSLNKNDEIYRFWSTIMPTFFSATELSRNAILALSGIRLMTQFENVAIPNVCISDLDESLVVYQDPDLIRGQSVCARTAKYFEQTLQLMTKYTEDQSNIDNPDICGQMMAVNIVIFVYAVMHPVSPVPLISYDKSKVDLFEVCNNFTKVGTHRIKSVKGSVFESISFRESQIFLSEEDDVEFPIIEYLKDYVDKNVDIFDPNHIIYYQAISNIELGVYRSFKTGYMFPTYTIILSIVKSKEFSELLRIKDYISLKIMFHLSCICSVGNFKLTATSINVWDSFLLEFRGISFALFGGRFEDEFEQCLFDTVFASFQTEVELPTEYLPILGTMFLQWK